MVTEYMSTVEETVRTVLGPAYDPRQLWNSDEKPFNPALEAGKGRNSGTFLGGAGEPAPVVVTDPDKTFFTGEWAVAFLAQGSQLAPCVRRALQHAILCNVHMRILCGCLVV